jgi:quercetin dioxygenase-like cupin family protein|tara:strand:- start:94 stop:603 length:510 start_codon:yes stop_codon:yes gene_type:complete
MKEDLEIRKSLMEFQTLMLHGIAEEEFECAKGQTELEHHFTPKHETYGCHNYARQLFMPKGITVSGAIHKKAHLTFLMQGIMVVISEDGGKQRLTAPKTFVSPAGIKRAFWIEEDTTLVCVHMTLAGTADDLEEIEDEVLSPTYEAMGLEEPDLSSLNEFLEDSKKTIE